MYVVFTGDYCTACRVPTDLRAVLNPTSRPPCSSVRQLGLKCLATGSDESLDQWLTLTVPSDGARFVVGLPNQSQLTESVKSCLMKFINHFQQRNCSIQGITDNRSIVSIRTFQRLKHQNYRSQPTLMIRACDCWKYYSVPRS